MKLKNIKNTQKTKTMEKQYGTARPVMNIFAHPGPQKWIFNFREKFLFVRICVSPKVQADQTKCFGIDTAVFM